MSKNKELSQDYFDRHPNSDECHITSDGRVFHNAGSAGSYAAALEDNTVEIFNRDGKKAEDINVDDAQVVEALEDETPENETPEDETSEDETPENETPEDETSEDETPEDETPEDENGTIKLADFDAETTSYEQGKALFAELGLTAENKTKVAIFAALTAAKQAAQNQE